MTCVYDLFDCYTLSGMTVSENRARKQTYLKQMLSQQLQYKMEQKWVFVEYLLCDRHCTNCLTFHFYVQGPCQGFSFGGGMREKGSNDCTCYVPTAVSLVIQSTVRRWTSYSCCWYRFSLELACLEYLCQDTS